VNLRERELVLRDVELGYVTPEGAEQDYGVTVDTREEG